MSSPDSSRALAAEIAQRFGKPDFLEFLLSHRDEVSGAVRILQEQTRASLNAKDYATAIQLSEAQAEIGRVLGATAFRLQFLESICAYYLQSGDIDGMIRKGLSAREEAKIAQVPDGLGYFVRISVMIAEHAVNDVPFARRLMAETRAVCSDRDSASGQLWSDLLLLRLCMRGNDVARAKDYAASLRHGFDGVEVIVEHAPSPPSRSQAAQNIIAVAKHYYYELDDFDSTAALAQMAIDLAPDIEAYSVLGWSLLRLGRFSDAEPVWTNVVQLNPRDAPAYYSYAGAASGLGHVDDAISRVTRAIELDPGNVRYVQSRADLYRNTARYEKALADYRIVVALAESASVPDPDAGSESRSAIKADRNRGARDFATIARVWIGVCLEHLGRTGEALEHAEELTRSLNPDLRTAGFLLEGRLYQSSGRTAEAIEAATDALAVAPGVADALQLRADLYAHAGQIEEAIADLALLADRTRNPQVAAEMLSGILERNPGHSLALKWRGFAWFEQWRPSKAAADLEQAMASLPDDWQVHLWAGLSLIFYSLNPEERSWSDSVDFERVERAIAEIGTAVRLNPEAAEALATYKWLIDRAGCDDSLLSSIAARGNEPNGLFSVLPGVQEPCERYMHSYRLSERRAWVEAVEELKAAQSGFVAAGLPVLAGLLDLSLADQYLRLYRLQDAIDALERAKKWPAVHGRPLSSTFHAQADAEVVAVHERSGQPVVVQEIDYFGIYGIGAEFNSRWRRGLEAEVLLRSGNPRKAREALGDLGDWFDDVRRSVRQRTSFQALLAAATTVRDAGEYEHALELLRKMEAVAETSADRSALANAQGLIHEVLGHGEDAERSFNFARAQAGDDSMRRTVDMNLAQNHLRRGEPEQALAILDRIDIDKQAEAPNDTLQYYQLRAIVLLSLSRYEDAATASERALTVAEAMREDLASLDVRIDLLEKFREVYRIAVLIALNNRDTMGAFELVEKSKARAFLDQLAAGHLPVPEDGKPLQAVADRLRLKEQILDELRDAAVIESAPVNLELVARLNQLDDQARVLDEDRIPPALSLKRIEQQLETVRTHRPRIEREIERLRFKHWNQKAGTVLTIPDLLDLLSASATP